MKTMTCKQLGGACNQEFQANSFAEIAEMSRQHAMQMAQNNDAAHLKAMNDMRELMQTPDAMAVWFETKKNEFYVLAGN